MRFIKLTLNENRLVNDAYQYTICNNDILIEIDSITAIETQSSGSKIYTSNGIKFIVKESLDEILAKIEVSLQGDIRWSEEEE